MYLEKLESNMQDCEILNESVQAIGASDAFKLNAIANLIQRLSPEPSEVIVLSTNFVHGSFWKVVGIPIAQDLKQIASVLNELLDELHDRQKLLKCYGKSKHRVVVVIELDDLHSALRQRSNELNREYSESEVDGAVAMLKEYGSKIGIFVVESVIKPGIEIGCRIYSGTEAIKYVLDETTNVSQDVYQRITQRLDNQSHPCCLVVGQNKVVYPIEGITDTVTQLSISQIPESERAIEL